MKTKRTKRASFVTADANVPLGHAARSRWRRHRPLHAPPEPARRPQLAIPRTQTPRRLCAHPPRPRAVRPSVASSHRATRRRSCQRPPQVRALGRCRDRLGRRERVGLLHKHRHARAVVLRAPGDAQEGARPRAASPRNRVVAERDRCEGAGDRRVRRILRGLRDRRHGLGRRDARGDEPGHQLGDRRSHRRGAARGRRRRRRQGAGAPSHRVARSPCSATERFARRCFSTSTLRGRSRRRVDAGIRLASFPNAVAVEAADDDNSSGLGSDQATTATTTTKKKAVSFASYSAWSVHDIGSCRDLSREKRATSYRGAGWLGESHTLAQSGALSARGVIGSIGTERGVSGRKRRRGLWKKRCLLKRALRESRATRAKTLNTTPRTPRRWTG